MIMSTVLTSSLPAADRLRAERMVSAQEFVVDQVAYQLIRAHMIDDLTVESTTPWHAPR
jgi:hypothetical protein